MQSFAHIERAGIRSTNPTIRPAPRLAIRQILRGLKLQRFTVSGPDNSAEDEADRIAAQVMRMPYSALSQPISDPAIDPSPFQPSCIQRRLCPECEDEVQRRHERSQPAMAASTLDGVELTLRQTGRPLDRATRDFFESRLGFDFGNVRIHTDANAALSASAINARAYTVGRNVVFNIGEYAPHTHAGRLLLAHELTHVMQQSLSTGVRRNRLQAGHGSRGDRSDLTTPALRIERGRRAERADVDLGRGFSIHGGPTSCLSVMTSPLTIHRAIKTACLAPSEVPSITESQAAGFGRIAEVPIIMDYCAATGGCALMVSDYIDTDAASYIAFLAANNPHLTAQDIVELAIAATVTGGLSRPDVITHKPPRFEFEEVKPDSITGRLAGRLKLGSLATLFARFSLPYLPGTTWSGTGRVPLFTLPGGVTIFLQWHRNLPGLVVYNLCVRGEASVLAAYGIAAILIAAILIYLTRGRILRGAPGTLPPPLTIPGFASAAAPDTGRTPRREEEAPRGQGEATELA